MPLPLILVPLAVAGGSALIQTVAKLKSHARLNALRDELEVLESRHRAEMRQQYDRQLELCRQLGRAEPELPQVLQEPEQPETSEPPTPWWRKVLKRRAPTLADGSPHTRLGIIGRHGGSFAASAVWRTLSVPIMNVVRPMAVRLLTFLPRIATIGGTGGSIAASTGLRFALGAFTIVGIILGPVFAAWSIVSEIRNVKKAQAELETTRIRQQAELTRYAARTRQLQSQLATADLE
jgi:hypothetical protein